MSDKIFEERQRIEKGFVEALIVSTGPPHAVLLNHPVEVATPLTITPLDPDIKSVLYP